MSARWFSASPCCTISELCGVGSLSPRRLAQRSVHPGNLLTVARTIPWPVAVLRPYSSACAPTTRRVSCAWGSSMKTGIIKKIDEYGNCVKMEDGTEIPIEDIMDINDELHIM